MLLDTIRTLPRDNETISTTPSFFLNPVLFNCVYRCFDFNSKTYNDKAQHKTKKAGKKT